MRIVTLNANGIRSANNKGLANWMNSLRGWDVFCLQEMKANVEDVPEELLRPKKSHGHFHPAEKKGYAGVALYCKREPDRVQIGTGIKWIDAEGRYLQADFGNLSIISLYVPSGSASEEAQAKKFRFMKEFMPFLKALKATGRELGSLAEGSIPARASNQRLARCHKEGSARSTKAGTRVRLAKPVTPAN